MQEIYHIIEHYPPGTIYNLIYPLTKYKNHKVFLIKNKNQISELQDVLSNKKDVIIVLHCTGRMLPVFSRVENLFKENKIYIYMHVSYDYLKYNKRYSAIKKLNSLSSEGVIVLCPSNKVSEQYQTHGIQSIVIRPGIQKIELNNQNEKLTKYYGKIISTCTGNRNSYKKIKGINKLIKIIKRNSLENLTLFVGSDLVMDENIESIKLSHDDFLEVLRHALVYVQLSKYESYNITAVESKQLKIPIILSNVEGHYESSGNGFLVENDKEAEKQLLDIIDNHIDWTIIDDNYYNSLSTESLDSFYQEFLKLVM